MSGNGDLKVERTSSDRTFDYYTIEGFTVEEMKYILDGNGDGTSSDDRFVELMEKHGYKGWKDTQIGYGIYSVRHVGGHLFVMTGRNCD